MSAQTALSPSFKRPAKHLLLAAGPQLLAACEARLCEWHDDNRNFLRAEPESVVLARAAIKLARGAA